jgi:ABC-type transport system involved in multi-copper enzyme maturation permease subunit
MVFSKKGNASMTKVILSMILVLAIIYIVPIVVYGLASAVAGLKTPEGASPAQFLISVLVSKIGTAIAFVLIFYFARNSLSGQWLLYAFIWWLMFVFGEVGQAIGPDYSWKEAIAGMISETIYLPLSAYVTHWLIT